MSITKEKLKKEINDLKIMIYKIDCFNTKDIIRLMFLEKQLKKRS